MTIRKVGVLGCGLMGAGIAEVAAKCGFETVVREVSRELLDKGMGRLRASLDRAVEKSKLEAAARDATLGRLTGTTEFGDFADCDLVVEAIVENLDEKKKTFAALDAVVQPGAIFASNTSSLTVTQLAAATQRPERVLGLHFFNPVPVMKLVEVVRTLLADLCVDLRQATRGHEIRVRADRPLGQHDFAIALLHEGAAQGARTPASRRSAKRTRPVARAWLARVRRSSGRATVTPGKASWADSNNSRASESLRAARSRAITSCATSAWARASFQSAARARKARVSASISDAGDSSSQRRSGPMTCSASWMRAGT